MERITYQALRFTVNGADEEITISADADKTAHRIKGISVSVTDESAIFSTLNNFRIANKELYPANYEILMLYASKNIEPDRKYKSEDEPAAGSKIEGKYIDSGLSTYPYTVTIYLKLSTNES